MMQWRRLSLVLLSQLAAVGCSGSPTSPAFEIPPYPGTQTIVNEPIVVTGGTYAGRWDGTDAGGQ